MNRRNFIWAASGIAGSLFAGQSRAAKPCPPPLVGIAGGSSVATICPAPNSGNPLGSLAASMAPGTWARLTPANQNSVLGGGPSAGTMLHYCNTMPWNPVSKCIEILGKDAGPVGFKHARYVESSNQFVVVAADAGIEGLGHAYDHNTVNPFTGDLYHRVFGTSRRIEVRKKASGASSFTPIDGIAASDQDAIGTCWWSGQFAGAGSQGCLMIFNSGNVEGNASDGQILAFDPLASRWFYSETGKAPFYGGGSTYHSVIEYSARKNVAVYGGGNAAPNKLWRLNPDGSFMAMPDVPAGMAVGMQAGLLVDEPATGNFLLLSNGELWELNPSGSGTWTRQTGTRVPPAGVGRPGPNNPEAVTCTSIVDHGVVAFITQLDEASGSMFLYKHA